MTRENLAQAAEAAGDPDHRVRGQLRGSGNGRERVGHGFQFSDGARAVSLVADFDGAVGRGQLEAEDGD